MAAAIPFIIAASAVVSAVSAVRQGQAAEAAGNFNATVSEQNAQIARQDATDQARQVDRENYLRLGAIRASQGKAGGDAGQGSVLDVLADAAGQGELDKQMTLYQGELKARGYQNTAALDRVGASNAVQAGYMKAGSELLSGGANAYVTNNKLTRA